MGQLGQPMPDPDFSKFYPISALVAERFSRSYEVYVCPFCISVYSKHMGKYIEVSYLPALGNDKSKGEK